jgi:hypothetical protein
VVVRGARRLAIVFGHALAAVALPRFVSCSTCHEATSEIEIDIPYGQPFVCVVGDGGLATDCVPVADGGGFVEAGTPIKRDPTYDARLKEALDRPCLETCKERITWGDEIKSCTPGTADRTGRVGVHCEYSYTSCPPACGSLLGSGRRPDGYIARGAPLGTLAELFARSAELEHVSVHAFRVLRRDLSRLGAPRSLLRSASRAARDERRHARRMRAHAYALGATASAPDVPREKERSLEAVATENAVEGCVRELYGALLATWAARHAANAEVRASMRRIARDETRHAALALEVRTWLDGRLDRAARRRVRAAQHQAIAAVVSDAAEWPAPALLAAGMLPPPDVARSLAEQLQRAVWAPS